jgi:hypothetical protein
MYSFTAVDPDHKFKGSRDPLGFQKIWSDTGRLLIKHLSTVSSNIHDFQIWCYANNFFMKQPNSDKKNFLNFFLMVEQTFAYARYKHNNEKAGFNGKQRVVNHFQKNENGTIHISSDKVEQILSNQKAYGIYGKYSRPARDMKLTEGDEFFDLFDVGFNNPAREVFEKIYNSNGNLLVINIDELKPIADLIHGLRQDEKGFFRDKILIGKTDWQPHPQTEFYELTKANSEIPNLNGYDLFEKIKTIKNLNISENLALVVNEIDQTERVLAPLNYHFTKLLESPIWKPDDFPENQCYPVEYDFKSKEVNSLKEILKNKDNKIFTRELIKRNNSVSKKRDSIGWIRDEGDRLVRLYGEALNNAKKEFTKDYSENPYFIQTYLSLFNQIENQPK